MASLAFWIAFSCVGGFWFWTMIQVAIGEPLFFVPMAGREIALDLLQVFALFVALTTLLITVTLSTRKTFAGFALAREKLARDVVLLAKNFNNRRGEIGRKVSIPFPEDQKLKEKLESVADGNLIDQYQVSLWGRVRWSIALYLLAWSIWLIVQTWTNIRLAGEQSEPTLINLDWLHGLLFIVAWCTSCVVITSAVNEHIRRVQVPIDRLRWEQESTSESAQQMTDYVRSLPANKAGSRLDNVPARSPRIVEERSYPDPPKMPRFGPSSVRPDDVTG